MLKRIVNILMAIFFVTNLSIGQVYAADQDNVNCEAPQSQFEMNRCAHISYLKADEKLNQTYKDARTAMQEVDQYIPKDAVSASQALLNAQRAWLKFRDLACDAEGYMFYGGTMSSMIVSGCLERLTHYRIDDLKVLIEIN